MDNRIVSEMLVMSWQKEGNKQKILIPLSLALSLALTLLSLALSPLSFSRSLLRSSVARFLLCSLLSEMVPLCNIVDD